MTMTHLEPDTREAKVKLDDRLAGNDGGTDEEDARSGEGARVGFRATPFHEH
jgi:hypothetical protein